MSRDARGSFGWKRAQGQRTDPDKVAHLAAYYDAEVSERESRGLPEQREHFRDLFLEATAANGTRAVLELGCGPGLDASALAAAGLDYTGVDLSFEAVATCGRRGFRACVADVTSLPFPTGAFDAVWTMSTLLHLNHEELGAALSEIRRVVRPGGIAAIGLWGADATREEYLQVDGWPARYFHLLSDDDLRETLAHVGRLERWETWTPDSSPLHYQWALLERTSRAADQP